MPKKYLVMLSLATATGYGLGEADLLEAQAKPMKRAAAVKKVLGPAASTTVESFGSSQMCPAVDTEFGLTPGTCTIDTIKNNGGMMIYWRVPSVDEEGEPVDGFWFVQSNIKLDGSWVPDE